jgi:hypothetical protein
VTQPVLITGTGRCRTGWAYRTLHGAGMDITHQGIRHEHAIDRWRLFEDRSDVSFEAAPLAFALKARGWRILLLIRDPAEVVRSWMSLGAFSQTMHLSHTEWWTSMRIHTPRVTDESLDPILRATRFYIGWNRLVLNAEPEAILRVEETDASNLCRSVLGEGDYDDPGVVDLGTPFRLPIALSAPVQHMIRSMVSEQLGGVFSYADKETK